MNPKMKHEKEVAAAAATVCAAGPMLAAKDIPSMVDSVSSDLTRIGIGAFCTLRAGVGLTCIKQLNEHGGWEARMMELFPNRSLRTLQRYMEQACDFMDAHGVMPEQAWSELIKIDATQLDSLVIAAPTTLALGTGETGKDPANKTAKRGCKAKRDAAPSPEASTPTFWQMLLDYIRNKNTKAVTPKGPEKTLTGKERKQAAINIAAALVNRAADYVSDCTWALLPDDELESTWAGLKAAADKLSAEIKKRNKTK
jgi:hypothetical protein